MLWAVAVFLLQFQPAASAVPSPFLDLAPYTPAFSGSDTPGYFGLDGEPC